MTKPDNAKERGLIKGAIMRVFSRSELRRKVIEASIIHGYVDATRSRVKTWCRCLLCLVPTPKSYMEVDHITPKIPLNSSLESMTWDELIEKTWCSITNLQAICESCHNVKTKYENSLRRKFKKERKV